MNLLTAKHFNLKQIADSGQVFRMNRIPDAENGYFVISRGKYAEIFQDDIHISINCPKEDLDFWKRYFDLDTDYGFFADSVRGDDQYLEKAAKAGGGIRILRQDTWEMIITFILSQQKTIPKIKEAVEALCRSYGTKREVYLYDELGSASLLRSFYEFPDAAQLSAASLEDLKELKLGYRAKYIHRVCADCNAGNLDLIHLHSLGYESAIKYLTGFYGIGIKVANCICLFGLHHIDAFPVDTWIEQILTEHYYDSRYDTLPKKRLYQTMIEEHFGCYKGYGGVMQQYIFYYERVVVQGKR